MTEYRFLDKDPIIDIIRTAVFKSRIPIKLIAAQARIRPATISRWLYGDTRRPQNYTIQAVLTVLGVRTEYTWEDSRTPVLPTRPPRTNMRSTTTRATSHH